MKSILENDGLSARQTTIHNIRKAILRGRPLWMVILVVSFLLSSCQEKTNGQHSGPLKKIPGDSVNQPKVSINVNRKYDDKGNLIGFDSTYTSYYSNVRGDTVQMDSLMNSFDRYFGSRHRFFFKDEFEPLFFTDSLRYPDFFHDDFFMKRYELNDEYFRGMMHRMDSIKNQFYQERSKKDRNSKDL